MTIVSTTAFCLLAICAYLAGRAAVVSIYREKRIKNLAIQHDNLKNRLDYIEYSSIFDRDFLIEEDPINGRQYNVIMNVTVREPRHWGNDIQCVDRVLIKSFPFEDDRQFARNEAEELLENLNA